MTVCVAVRVHDAMVFAADSATTLEVTSASGARSVANVFMTGDKVFNLYRGLPIIAMTCGMGHIAERTIGSLAKELRLRLTEGDTTWRLNPRSYTIREVAEKAHRFFFEERYSSLNPVPPAPHRLEFWIGGYTAGSEQHDLWVLTIANGVSTLTQRGQVGETGLWPGGQPDPILRLLQGVSPAMVSQLVSGGLMPQQDAEIVHNFLKAHNTVQIVSPSMPIGDAIDVTRYLAEMTKGFFRFKPGADIVGGDLDIAVVTRYEGFKWISRKHYYPQELNLRETDHVGENNHPSRSIGNDAVDSFCATKLRLSKTRSQFGGPKPKRPCKPRKRR